MFEILPNLAVYFSLGLAALLWIFFVLLGLGFMRLWQKSTPTTNQLVQEVFARGQQNDYESLIALDFVPLGKYQEGLGRFDRPANGFAFGHPTLPVSCLLRKQPSGIITKHMFSDDGAGRMLVSGDYNELNIECDERNLFSQVDSHGTVEGTFRAHLTALDVWEADGFKPIQVKTLEDFESQRQQYWNNSRVKKALLEIALNRPTWHHLDERRRPCRDLYRPQFLYRRDQV